MKFHIGKTKTTTTTSIPKNSTNATAVQKDWIRGVNIGGWLVFERYITPYFFALTDCHLKGDFRYYEGQIDAPPTSSPLYKPMDEAARKECTALSKYPEDTWDLTPLFDSKEIAGQYFDIHYDNFLKREDVAFLKAHGVTHFRVPLPHWILGNVAEDEPYVPGNAWKYFKRLASWAREEGIQLWPDLHTAPGSQNGFDNSGHIGGDTGKILSCDGWFNYPNGTKPAGDGVWEIRTDPLPPNVLRTLDVIDQITAQVKKDGMDDVVTGFGVINEPAPNCNHPDMARFYTAARDIIIKNWGEKAHIYLGDTFLPEWWNDFWYDPKYKNTYMDSHAYHPFDVHARTFSPREHIAMVCERDHKAVTACCYHDGGPTKGIGRIFTEWSAAFDQGVGVKVDMTMKNIRWTNQALGEDTVIPPKRKAFLRDFVEAQIVNFESKQSSGWFYWNFKMEGGYFPEWDMMRGLREGWFPTIPAPDVNSVDLFGSCFGIMKNSSDDMSIIETFPPSPPNLDEIKNEVTDDIVLTHGEWMEENEDGFWVNTNPAIQIKKEKEEKAQAIKDFKGAMYNMLSLVLVFMLVSLMMKKNLPSYSSSRGSRGKRAGYKAIDDDEDSDITDETTDVRMSSVSLAEMAKQRQEQEANSISV